MKVVIIAGGQGTRIASVNSEIPKAMIPVGGKPILEHEIELAKRYGHTEFVLVTGHLGSKIHQYFGDGSNWGVSIEYFDEDRPLGTAGALAYLGGLLTDDFFVMYGDTVLDIDMDAMLSYHRSHDADATLLVHPNDHPYDSDLVEIDDEGRVTRLLLKPHTPGLVSRNLVNASMFIFSPKVITMIAKGTKSHIEKDVLPACLACGMRLFGYVSFEYIKDMGTPDRYDEVCHDFESGTVAMRNRSHARRAIFLDRDGTINREINLLHQASQMRLIDGVADAIRMINKSGYLAIVVTNQPVIARNLCTFDELDAIHATMETLLGKERAYINALYYCPHHPDGGYPEERKEYKVACQCRKPSPGMLLQAAADWNIDLAQSYMIGDRDKDVEAGQRAGCKQSFLIPRNQPGALKDVVCKILEQANPTTI